MSRFFDAHCHVRGGIGDDPPPPATECAVGGRVLCCVEPADWPRLARVSGVWKGSIAAYGVHPWRALSAAGGWLEELERRLLADPEAWVGEAGLDGLRLASAPAAAQEHVFSEQLRLARRLDRRVNAHCVKAWDDFIKRLDADYLAGGTGREFIVHSFSGPRRCVRDLTLRGAYFSIGGLFAKRDSARDRERAASVPEDRLLLESDAFLVPGADGAGELERAFVWLAGARKTPAAALAGALRENSRRLAGDG